MKNKKTEAISREKDFIMFPDSYHSCKIMLIVNCIFKISVNEMV